jgi:hypothetical protein
MGCEENHLQRFRLFIDLHQGILQHGLFSSVGESGVGASRRSNHAKSAVDVVVT